MTAPLDWRTLLQTLPYNGAPADIQPLPNFSGPTPPMTPMSAGGTPATADTGAPSGPSFLSRVGTGLFPGGASPLSALLDPAQLTALRTHALLGLGANLLSRSGPRPVGTSSPLSDLGQALGASQAQWPQMLEGAASQAAQLNQLTLAAKQRQAVQGFIQEHPLPENASPSDVRQWIAQAIPAFLASGNEAGIAQLGQLMTGLEGGSPTFQKGLYNGRPTLMRVAKDGTSQPVMGPDGKPLEPTPDEATVLNQQNTQLTAVQHLWQSDKQVTDGLGSLSTIRTAASLIPAAAAGNASAQYGLIDNVLRTYNPGATVRGNSIQQLREMLPLSQKAIGEFQAVAEGKGALSPQTVREMAAALQQVQTSKHGDLERAYARYGKRITAHGGNPSDYLDLPDAVTFPGIANPTGPHSKRAAKDLHP